MNSFDSLEDAIISPNTSITPDETAFADEELSDEVALAIVLQDTSTAETYLQSKALVTSMDRADDLYRGWVRPRYWPNGKPRANLSAFTVLEAIEKILPSLHLTLWGTNEDPFELIPKGKTTPDAARAKGKVLAWAIKQANLREEMRKSLKTCLLYGWVVGNWGWESKTKKFKKYVRDENGKIAPKLIVKDTNQPFYRTLDMRKVLVDPACNSQDVRESAKYVIYQVVLDADDLDSLRADPGYKNVPTREELRLILASNNDSNLTVDSLRANKSNVWRDLQAEPDIEQTSLDPMSTPLELLEYWTEDRVITVLNRCIVIRNEENEFGKKTQVSCAFIDVIGSGWGFGIAKLLSGEQAFQSGTRNSWVDSLSLTMNPMYQQAKGMGLGTEQITSSPGKVVTSSGELKPLTTTSVSTEALNAIGDSEQRASRLVGANNGSGMPMQALRTAEGINAYAGDVVQRLQYFLEIFVQMVFVPVLEAFIEMCTDKLDEGQINDILAEDDGKAYDGDILDVYNATAEISVTAGQRLTARIAASQLVPQIITLLSNGPVQQSFVIQNKKFNYAELIEESLSLSGWDIDALIVDMTAEDQQRAQQQSDALVRGQQMQQLEAQKQQNVLQQIDEKGFVQAGVGIVRQAAKSSAQSAEDALSNMQGLNQQAPPQGTQQ
jgi:hypothetical protein